MIKLNFELVCYGEQSKVIYNNGVFFYLSEDEEHGSKLTQITDTLTRDGLLFDEDVVIVDEGLHDRCATLTQEELKFA